MKKLSVFLDADVIFAGAAAPTEHGASHVVLRMGEITLIECVTSTQAITEVERNLADKLPSKLPERRLIISRSLHVVPNPEPEELVPYKGQADPKDLPILVAALKYGCRFLLTFNIRDYSPATGEILIQRPGDFIVTVRALLAQLAAETAEQKAFLSIQRRLSEPDAVSRGLSVDRAAGEPALLCRPTRRSEHARD